MSSVRATFSSKLGMVMAAAGSAVGLGNLWRFPYVAAENGGGAFLMIYLAIVATIGLTMILVESALGMRAKTDAVGALKAINPKFGFIGGIGILAGSIIVPYYCVIGGWIMAYIAESFSLTTLENFEEHFSTFIASPVPPALYFVLFLGLTGVIVYRGIQNGIEKACKIMMPALFVLLLILMVRSLTLPNALDGVKFFFKPDFSKITGETFLQALGQAFFSLSVGMGIYITFGSYANTEAKVFKTMWPVPTLDTLVSLLTGLTIFPAVFAFGISMNAGPSLVFITFPKIFASIPFGAFFSLVFFALLLMAALTSSMSLMEVVVTFLCDQWKMTRKKAVISYSLLSLVGGVLVSLSFGVLSGFKIGGKILFDQFDFLASNILLPTGGFLICIATGWVLGVDKLNVFHSKAAEKAFAFSVRYITPIAVAAVLLNVIGLI